MEIGNCYFDMENEKSEVTSFKMALSALSGFETTLEKLPISKTALN